MGCKIKRLPIIAFALPKGATPHGAKFLTMARRPELAWRPPELADFEKMPRIEGARIFSPLPAIYYEKRQCQPTAASCPGSKPDSKIKKTGPAIKAIAPDDLAFIYHFDRDAEMKKFILELGRIKDDYSGNYAEYEPHFNAIKEFAQSGKLDAEAIFWLFGEIYKEGCCDRILKAAMAGNPKIIKVSDINILVKKFRAANHGNGEGFDVSRQLEVVARNNPRLFGPIAFRELIEEMRDYAELEKRSGPWATENICGGEGILNELIKDPEHYARLLVAGKIDKDVLLWLVTEKKELDDEYLDRDLKMYDLRDAVRDEMADEEEAERPGGALIRKDRGAITPVLTGDHFMDKFFVDGLRSGGLFDTKKKYLEMLEKIGYFDHDENYFPKTVLLEVAKHLKTKRRAYALDLLQKLAEIDMNMVLSIAVEIDKDIGVIVGLREKQAVDYAVVVKNMERYALQSLSTAWAIGDRELTKEQLQQLLMIEKMMKEKKEHPAVVFRVINAILDETCAWQYKDIMHLWGLRLFAGTRSMHFESMDRILRLNQEEKQKFLMLMERPGKLTHYFMWDVCDTRFGWIMKKLGSILALSREEFEERLELLNRYPFAIEERAFAVLMSTKSYPAGRDILINMGKYALGVSHGMRARIDSFINEYGEKLTTMIPGIKGKKKQVIKTPEQALAAIAGVFAIPLFEANEEKIKRSFKKLALKYHSDRKPDDPGSLENFLMLNEAKSIYLAVLNEVRTGKSLPDHVVIPLPKTNS